MTAFALAPLTPWLLPAGLAWIYYRRIRRQFGRQPYRPRRAAVRAGVLSLVGVGLIVVGFAQPHLAAALALGAIVGAALGWLAQRHMHVAIVDGACSYTPNPWIGGALSLLLVARLAWRWHQGAFAFGAQSALPQTSPLTFGFLAVIIAYYLVSTIGLVLRMRALAAADGSHAEPVPRDRA